MKQEDFSHASALKKELTQLESKDVVAAVQQQLSSALQEERYSDAAYMRDAGLAALQVQPFLGGAIRLLL